MSLLILHEADRPVFTYRAFEAHVKSDVAFKGRVDHPVGALDPAKTFVELLEAPGKLDLVVGYSYDIHQSEELAVRFILFGLPDKSVGKRCFLSLLLD